MRVVTSSVLISLMLLMCGCKKDKLPMVSVRFENIMYDHYVFPYGMMFGDAVFGGSLGYGETTPYLETSPGAYPILARRVDGQWVEISEGMFNVLGGLSYTILIFGTVERFTFQLKEDL